MNFGFEEGEVCGREGCEGVIKMQPTENCSCHLSAPCGQCTSRQFHCPECGWVAEEEKLNDFVMKVDPVTRQVFDWKPRPLDPTKIDWHSKSHTNASMIKEGVYPEGVTREEVRKAVDGTFGGRFAYFEGGKFKFIAYTD